MSSPPGSVGEEVLAVENLVVRLWRGPAIVEDVSITLRRGEVLGVVGESGSGKTTVGLALLGFARPGAVIAGGRVRVAGVELIGAREQDVRSVRGRLIAYVPQDPSTSLNPSLRVGRLLRGLVEAHRPELDAHAVASSVLERVNLPSDRAFQRRFPHQLSGGQQQRLAIGMAIATSPPVVVLDEPTTGLDVVTQARILDEIARLRDELGIAMVYVSHNLAVVGAICDRIAVMYGGRVVEDGPAQPIIHRPRHPYTRGLVSSIPDHLAPRRLHGLPGVAVGVGDRPPGCAFFPRCPQASKRGETEQPMLEPVGAGHRVRCFDWRLTPPLEQEPPLLEHADRSAGQALLAVDGLRAEHRGPTAIVVAAADVSFTVARGECVALVGESGSGKTTIARCVVGLHAPSAGGIALDGEPLAGRARERSREQRRRIQIVFQNPYDSLNPRHRIDDSLTFAARALRDRSKAEALADVADMLERVRLPRAIGRRYPRELSGGERQRVAIARALVARPDLLVCDEVTSALDVSVQAAVLELLAELRRDLGLAMLFITHDLGVVANVGDRILVLDRGRVCEEGPVAGVLANPADAYTRLLLDAAPRLSEPALDSVGQ
jgi:peptide/nickel transport system ATP-binding protein